MNRASTQEDRPFTISYSPESKHTCSFCGGEPVCERSEEPLAFTALLPSGALHYEVAYYSACAACSRLVDQNDEAALFTRSLAQVRQHWPKGAPPLKARVVRQAVRLLFTTFQTMRQGHGAPCEE